MFILNIFFKNISSFAKSILFLYLWIIDIYSALVLALGAVLTSGARKTCIEDVSHMLQQYLTDRLAVHALHQNMES